MSKPTEIILPYKRNSQGRYLRSEGRLWKASTRKEDTTPCDEIIVDAALSIELALKKFSRFTFEPISTNYKSKDRESFTKKKKSGRFVEPLDHAPGAIFDRWGAAQIEIPPLPTTSPSETN